MFYSIPLIPSIPEDLDVVSNNYKLLLPNNLNFSRQLKKKIQTTAQTNLNFSRQQNFISPVFFFIFSFFIFKYDRYDTFIFFLLSISQSTRKSTKLIFLHTLNILFFEYSFFFFNHSHSN